MALEFDPVKHPRDRHGRFTRSRTSPLSEAERLAARSVIAGFKPVRFSDAGQMAQYSRQASGGRSHAEMSAIDSYTGDDFLKINQKLRAGGDLGSDATTVENLRSAMRPASDDLLLKRTVALDVFKGLDIESLAGMKVKDAGFSSTSLGAAFSGDLGNVVMKIAVPKGTPVIFAAPHSRNPHEMEVILPDGMEFAVASVTKNDRYGWDMSLVVIPKQQPLVEAA